MNAPRRPLAAWTVGLAGAWLAVRIATGFDGLSGQDPYEYARFGEALRFWLLSGADPGLFFWPVLYPLAGGALSLVGLPVGTALHVVSVFPVLVSTALPANCVSPTVPRTLILADGVESARSRRSP